MIAIRCVRCPRHVNGPKFAPFTVWVSRVPAKNERVEIDSAKLLAAVYLVIEVRHVAVGARDLGPPWAAVVDVIDVSEQPRSSP